MSTAVQATHAASSFASALRLARLRTKLSQLELALRLEVSQRHVSFVETGRSRPGRALLCEWLAALELPLSLRNELMLQAGYAPLYTAGIGAGTGDGDEVAMRAANQALERLLTVHDPMPAMVLNARWDVLRINAGANALLGLVMPELARVFSQQLASFQAGNGPAPNVADAMLHPQGFASRLLNPQDVCPAVLAHMRQDAVHEPALQPRVAALAAMLKKQFGAARVERIQPLELVVTSRFRSSAGDLAFFSMFTTFGSPQSIGLASLRVEHMFAADTATEELMQRLPLSSGGAGPK